mmetsp:Transcript_25136/g.46619  ORF Transcript_25136/g.46619 Transcript_25136/m.46619 type:complete len:482 (-) Transcript_25136:116-1561(-)
MKLPVSALVMCSAIFTGRSELVKDEAPSIQDFRGSIKLRPEVASQVQEFRQTPWSQYLTNVLNNTVGDVDACKDPFEEFFTIMVQNIDPAVLKSVTEFGIDQIPLYYSLLVNNNDSGEYFGTFAEETTEILLANDALEIFWGSADDDGGSALITNNFLLLGMHGADMKDRDKLIPTLELMYDLTDDNITYYDLAGMIEAFVVDNFPHEYDNPIFTFNAYAYSPGDGGDEKIVIGDGIMEYMQFKNLGYDGPEVILSHEFGHQMQFEAGIDYLGTLPAPLETRRFELMADAFSGYFLAHRQGGNIGDGNRVLGLSEAISAVGDCDAENDGHHGTPRQRKCALTWGVNMAAESGEEVLHPDELQLLFDEDLDRIINLENSVCQLSIGAGGGLPGDNRAAPGGSEEEGTTATPIHSQPNLRPCGSCEENPCTWEAISAGKFYHQHCSTHTKFLQCGPVEGMCYEMTCAPGTVWSQGKQTCVTKY